MTREERQHYVDVIKALYKTSISVDEVKFQMIFRYCRYCSIDQFFMQFEIAL